MTRVNDNVLYVQSESAFIHQKGETVCVRIEDEQRLQVPFTQLAGVAIFGRSYVTPELMKSLSAAGVSLAYFDDKGRFQGRLEGVPSGNIVLRDAQFRVAHDNDASAKIVKSIVIGKLSNQQRYLRRCARDVQDEVARKRLVDGAGAIARAIKTAMLKGNAAELRGYEGAGAMAYFGAFDSLCSVKEKWARLNGRSRRPPRSAMNAALSFGYALLCSDCVSALTAAGLDPGRGYLHSIRSGRPALALDLMEEFRVAFVDRLVLAMLNRRQLKSKHFDSDAGGAVSMTKDGRTAFLTAYQNAKMKRTKHPFLKTETRFSKIPTQQARLLGRTIRGDLEVYPPFVIES